MDTCTRCSAVAEVGRRIAGILGVPFASAAVSRTQQIAQLKDVGDFGERQRLLADAHAFDSLTVKGKSILLFDDLFRSGATMSVVAEGLRAAGATRITALTLTRTRSSR
ncbi:MAG: hypothetical protein DI536_34430 [Archangium gephyra]|uniref:Phosphoribosyltransferase domain-containing protein n=1 Tax=Archangium gephyra TaxID=48 RepID=A0A2W5V328_9BACT|nr:MAG: hypothetical protein DI536_34430 [Archangium gephyra]